MAPEQSCSIRLSISKNRAREHSDLAECSDPAQDDRVQENSIGVIKARELGGHPLDSTADLSVKEFVSSQCRRVTSKQAIDMAWPTHTRNYLLWANLLRVV